MMRACQKFLSDRLEELTLLDGVTRPYLGSGPGKNVFFEDLPTDFLKDNDFAACCLPLRDNSKKEGRRIAAQRILGARPQYDITTRRFQREITYRCLLYGGGEELWGDEEHDGMAEQLSKAVARYRVIADDDDSAIRVEPQELARPWDSDVEMAKKVRRPRLAIVRIFFRGGIQTSSSMPILTGIELVPKLPMTGESKQMLTSESTGQVLVSEDITNAL